MATAALGLVAACSSSARPVPTAPPDAYSEDGVSAKVDRATATAMIENALTAFNAGDYNSYTRDWSDTMKAAIKEKDFLAVRAQISDQVGRFVEITELKLVPGQNPGIVRWVATARFERSPAVFWIAFPADGTKIEGARFEPIK
jgi:hypothetical protein